MVAVLVNSPAGLLPATEYSAGGLGAITLEAVAVGDFNNDDIPDILAGVGASVALLPGDGTGRFAAAQLTGASPFSIRSIAVANFDGDSSVGAGGIARDNLDVVTTHADGRVAILFGDGASQFPRRAEYPGASAAVSAATGDLNRDGRPDLAFIDFELQRVVVRLNAGAGTLGPAVSYFVGDAGHAGVTYRPLTVRIAELTGDRKLDLVTANNPLPRGTVLGVSVLFGNGLGAFASARPSPFAVSAPAAVATADLDGDARVDVVTVRGSTLTVLMNRSPF